MFDGPMALTKERDACGVGFIANVKTEGESDVFCVRWTNTIEPCTNHVVVVVGSLDLSLFVFLTRSSLLLLLLVAVSGFLSSL